MIMLLAGQMSMVGARPVVPEELKKYYKKTALTYCATKPGVTGLWQAGKRSDTEDYGERLTLDHVQQKGSVLTIRFTPL